MENRYSIPKSRESAQVDTGLRNYMGGIYNRMTAGVLVTALTAAIVGSSPMLMKLFLGGPQIYLVIFAPLLVVWFGFNPRTMNSRQLATSFFILAALYGITFSTIGYIYTKDSIAQAFFVATGMFAGLSIFGYTTKKNLDGLGTFCVMGMWGILIASLFAMFFHNPMLHNVISGVGIISFAGITAWHTQLIKESYNPATGQEMNDRMAWASALNLYISFIAIFQYLLQIFGNRN